MNAGYTGRYLQGGFSGLTVPNYRCAAIPTFTAWPAGHNHERSTNMTKKLFIGMLAVVCMVIFSLPAVAQRPGFGNLYYAGEMVRTVIPPAAMPFEGRDDLYLVRDQLAVAAVAPGDTDYHGGQWAVNMVDWNEEAYLLTSEEEVLAAEAAGDITITRVAENDFKCPIQP
jgi:hypothetical protein